MSKDVGLKALSSEFDGESGAEGILQKLSDLKENINKANVQTDSELGRLQKYIYDLYDKTNENLKKQ